MALRGCGTALVTPFTREGDLDESALRTLIESQIAAGVDFLIPCGTTGEASTLEQQERLRIITLTVETAAGRIPVYAGCTDNDTRKLVERARDFDAIPGLTGLLCANPFYNRPGQEGQYLHFRALAEATSLPIILYNIPSRTAANLEPATIVRLAQLPNIIAVKESSGSVMQITDILAAAARGELPPDFAVLAGDDGMALAHHRPRRHRPVVSVASNAFPRQIAAMVHAALAGNWTQARATNLRFFRLMQAHFAETSPAPIKAVLHLLNRSQETLRLPLVPVSDPLRQRLSTLLDELRTAGEQLD